MTSWTSGLWSCSPRSGAPSCDGASSVIAGQSPESDAMTDVDQRVLVVGTGSIARRHLRVVRQLVPQGSAAVLTRAGSTSAADFPVEDADEVFDSIEEALAW